MHTLKRDCTLNSVKHNKKYKHLELLRYGEGYYHAQICCIVIKVVEIVIRFNISLCFVFASYTIIGVD